MKIELKEIKVRDLFNGYYDGGDLGSIVGFGGLLNIRPAYQREFVYDDEKRNAVIDTVKKGFPLNVMYWAKVNGGFELLDGQQRTISICRYVQGAYSVDGKYYHNLTQAERDEIDNYKLMVYVCEGTDRERLDWFRIINIAGLKLTDQELRNANYTGPWLEDAKRFFSKNNCAAVQLSKGYVKGECDRQRYLEIALSWIADAQGLKSIEEYMAQHQHDIDASELKDYFQKVIDWVKDIFPKPKKNEMEGLDWGIFYNKHSKNTYDRDQIAKDVDRLQKDKDVTKKRGIFEYLLDGDERHLSIRTFDEDERLEVYTRQDGMCPMCQRDGRSKVDATHDKSNAHWELDEMEADHIVPWSKGGKTTVDNCQMLCRLHNGMKSNH